MKWVLKRHFVTLNLTLCTIICPSYSEIDVEIKLCKTGLGIGCSTKISRTSKETEILYWPIKIIIYSYNMYFLFTL